MSKAKIERVELKEGYRDKLEATILTFIDNGWTVHIRKDNKRVIGNDEYFDNIIVAEREKPSEK